MNSALGARFPSLRFRIPRFALMNAKGMRSLSRRRAVWEKGEKMGRRR